MCCSGSQRSHHHQQSHVQPSTSADPVRRSDLPQRGTPIEFGKQLVEL